MPPQLCDGSTVIHDICSSSSSSAAMGYYIWYSEKGPGLAVTPLNSLIAVPNVIPPINGQFTNFILQYPVSRSRHSLTLNISETVRDTNIVSMEC